MHSHFWKAYYMQSLRFAYCIALLAIDKFYKALLAISKVLQSASCNRQVDTFHDCTAGNREGVNHLSLEREETSSNNYKNLISIVVVCFQVLKGFAYKKSATDTSVRPQILFFQVLH